MTVPGELIPFTFQDTGIKVMIRKVSPLLVNELRKMYPEPKPPMQKVELDGKTVEEPNPAHPDYQRALEDYQALIEAEMRKLLIKRGVELELDEAAKKAIAQLRKEWKEDYQKDLPGSDKEVYISFIAVGTDGDVEDLINAIMKRSQPTKAEVDLHKASFPG